MSRTEIHIDSDYRLNDDYTNMNHLSLPHDEYGFNNLEGKIENGWLYYQDKKVIDWTQMDPFYCYTYNDEDEGAIVDYYWCFITGDSDYQGVIAEDQTPYLVREPVVLANVPITEAHLCFSVHGDVDTRKRIRGGLAERIND